MSPTTSGETPGLTDPPEGVMPITIEDAKILFQNYQASAERPAVPVKGVLLDRAQLAAMNTLLKDNPTLSAFRVFFGKETSGDQVGIVVGVDENNADLISRGIYKTLSSKTGPCPPVCDKASPIITA